MSHFTVERAIPSISMRKDVAQTMQDIFNAPSKERAKARLKLAVEKYQEKAPRLSEWLEENYEEGFMFFDYPEEHRKKIRTNNVSERLNQEIKRRTNIARLFPNSESALRLATAIVVEIHEEWISGRTYLTI